MSATALDADIAIVGLGPVGSALAGLLGARGVRTLAIERDADVFPLPRAAHIDHTGLRTLQELGCLDQLLPSMLPNPGLDYVAADGRSLLRIPGDQRSVSGLPASAYFHQPAFDRTLRATAAAARSVEVRVGQTLTGLAPVAGGVEVRMTSTAGETAATAAFVVGCDGASSVVRRSTGIGLDDLGFEERWLVVDVVLSRSVPDLPDLAVGYCDPSRPTFAIPIPGGRHRFELMLLPGEERAEMEDANHVLRLLAPWLPPGSAEVERAAVYDFHALVARGWREGRVLVAGDAAHQMPPFLGQGLCSGLRDVENLAWKLERVVRSNAPLELLDTYGSERARHVRAVVQASVELGRMLCILDPELAAARDRRVLEDGMPLIEAGTFSLPALEQGALVLEGGGDLFLQPEPVDGEPLLDDVVGARFLVLGRTAGALRQHASWWAEHVNALVATVDELPGSDALAGWLDARGALTAVVRPDRYVLATGVALEAVARRTEKLLVGL